MSMPFTSFPSCWVGIRAGLQFCPRAEDAYQAAFFHHTISDPSCPHPVQGFLGLAFLCEGLLFAFHLKGTELDWKLHLLLVLLILGAAVCCFAEMAVQHSVVLATLRTQLVLLQGVWFCQIANILFVGAHTLKNVLSYLFLCGD